MPMEINANFNEIKTAPAKLLADQFFFSIHVNLRIENESQYKLIPITFAVKRAFIFDENL